MNSVIHSPNILIHANHQAYKGTTYNTYAETSAVTAEHQLDSKTIHFIAAFADINHQHSFCHNPAESFLLHHKTQCMTALLGDCP